ncbi:E3 ubiquitin-protein ligase SHPRH-like [Artemia franciscana]|uniref:E3 ubiquitin-protein ligase SHPRH-like n=1 Tax=Artemia franciscana TaxID=6661 RepID=UPI0032D9BB16
MECIRALKQRLPASGVSITCPYCRQVCLFEDVSYVYTGADEGDKSLQVEVKGSHSTKVDALVREMLILKEEEPDSKSLIFSTWDVNLTIISNALEMNGISHCSLTSSKFQENLHRFKHAPELKALLLPVHSGANGLCILVQI